MSGDRNELRSSGKCSSKSARRKAEEEPRTSRGIVLLFNTTREPTLRTPKHEGLYRYGRGIVPSRPEQRALGKEQ